ncbi:MAG: hypothetical protein GY866_15700 [Proteobacteria bacterium]|nr:hypothetical protein [Pseudomonadota bacterium]
MDLHMKASLDAIFKPRSVAVIGASNKPGTFGHSAITGLIGIGFPHDIYPVNPSAKEIQGLRCYGSISEIAGPVDMAVIVVKASLVPQVMQECFDKGIKGGVLITAGFAELGADGAELQRTLVEKATQAHFHFIGPNCLGIRSSEGKVHTMFWNPKMAVPSGPVSFISQSGTLGGYFFQAALDCGFGVNKFISCGNQASISFSDLLEYLGDDPTTKVITGYIEGVQDGRRFLEVARQVAAKKPVVVYKAGASEASARAASSHTAAMSSNDRIFDAACRQAGIIRKSDFNEMFELADALCYQPIPRGNRVAVISGGGGFCVTTAEACSELGLELPELDAQVQAELSEFMEPFSPKPVNPIDCIGVHGLNNFYKTIETAAKQDYIDGLIVMPWGTRIYSRIDPDELIMFIETAKKIAAIPKKFNKPLILSGRKESMTGPIYNLYKRAHIPFFNNPFDSAKALAGLVRYGEIAKRQE